MLHHQHHPQAALDAKRFCVGSVGWSQLASTEAFYNRAVAIEDGVDPAVIQKLRDMGHVIDVIDGHAQIVFGKGQVILRTVDARTGKRIWAAGSDPRSDGAALPQI